MSWYNGLSPNQAPKLTFRVMMRDMIAEKYKRISIWDNAPIQPTIDEPTYLFYQAFHVARIEEDGFVLGIGNTYSSLYKWVKFSPADPELFANIEAQFRQIGVI